MSWYKKSKKIDLGDIGFDGLWVEYMPFTSMTYKEAVEVQKKFAVLQKQVEEAQEAGDEGVATEKGLEVTRMLLEDMIVAWNVPPPDGQIGDRPMPIPREDPSVVENLPIDVVQHIASVINGSAEDTVPNQNGSKLSSS